MSLLIDSLERLMVYMNQYMPDHANSFLPGLPEAQIQEMVERLGLPCPQEIIDLYQWRNGTQRQFEFIGYPPEFCFTPLEEIVEIYEEYRSTEALAVFDTISPYDATINSLAALDIHENQKLLPFLWHQGDIYTVVASTNESYVLYDHVEDGEPRLIFDNLTSMMQTLSVCYEEQVYYLSDEGSIEINNLEFSHIFQRYNPLTSEKVPLDLS
jgi:SMI1 / KNR4 family (SUKH-1)